MFVKHPEWIAQHYRSVVGGLEVTVDAGEEVLNPFCRASRFRVSVELSEEPQQSCLLLLLFLFLLQVTDFC